MTAEQQPIDRALDAALAKSRNPAVPADLVSRVTAEATAQPQRRIGGMFQARRTRRPARKRRARRPIVFGTIGGGLLAASAVAAALVSDGTFELARITKPVVELFVPEAPRETVRAPVAPAAPQRPATDIERDTPMAERVGAAQRPGWRLRQVRRAMIVRQRLERLRQARAEEAPVPERLVPRRAARIPEIRMATPEQRARVRARIESLTPEQRQRLRERRAATLPAVRDRVAERRRDHVSDRLRDRGVDVPVPVQRPSTVVPDALDRPVATRPLPTASTASESPAEPTTRRSMIIENAPPGPEPAPVDQVRPNLPAADTPAATSARRAALQQRIRAARAAERARAAQRRNGVQRPARPRVPPRRR